MDILLIMLILGLVVVFVTAPLRRSSPDGQLPPELASGEVEPELRELEAARDAKLRELRDAELDHRTRKLSDEDYQAVDATLRAETIEILRALDQVREGLAEGDEVQEGDGLPEGDGLAGGDGHNRSAADTIND